MDNMMLLQKQFLKPIKIGLAVTDILWLFLIIILALAGETELILYEFGWILIVLFALHLMLLEARKPSTSLKKLPPDVLKAIDEQCMTGIRLGNGILCNNDCLVFVGVTVTAVRLQDVTMLKLRTTTKGQITVYGVMSNNRDWRVINGANRMVQGKGTFREADRDSFWRELCNAWKKYTDTEPIEV